MIIITCPPAFPMPDIDFKLSAFSVIRYDLAYYLVTDMFSPLSFGVGSSQWQIGSRCEPSQRSGRLCSPAISHQTNLNGFLYERYLSRYVSWPCRGRKAGTVSSSWGKYADLVAGNEEAANSIPWHEAIVIQNKEACADGSLRSLVLSVSDEQHVLSSGNLSKNASRVQRDLRWLDQYTNPGQQIAVRIGASPEEGEKNDGPNGVVNSLFSITNSPYDLRMNSANLDAAIVEILVSKSENEWQQKMASFSPGTRISVSNIMGTGYTSLLDDTVNLESSLGSNCHLIFISVGPQGMAAARSALSWTPVQAHASEHKVALITQVESQTCAPFLVEYDDWRDVGIHIRPISCSSSDSFQLEEQIKLALFSEDVGIRSIARDAVIAISGVPAGLVGHLIKTLNTVGFSASRLLLADFL